MVRTVTHVVEASDHGNNLVDVTVTCPECKTDHSVLCDWDGYCLWEAGELIQHVLPELSMEEREILLTGICGSCWAKLFSTEEDE